MLNEEGLDNVFARHDRHAEATRRAVRAWGLETLCRDPKYYSPTVTAVLLPEGHDADAFRGLALDNFNISYGASFGPTPRNISASAISATSMTDADRRAGADRNGSGAGRHPAQEGRRAGGNGLHRLGVFHRRPRRGGVIRAFAAHSRVQRESAGSPLARGRAAIAARLRQRDRRDLILERGRDEIAAYQRSKCGNGGRSGISWR